MHQPRRSHPARRWGSILAVAGGARPRVVAGGDASTATPEPTTSAAPTTTAPATTAAPTTTNAPSTTAAPTTTGVASTTAAPTTTGSSGTLPGEPFDTYVPAAGELVAVVGVAHDDVLNVRSGPGVDFGIVATLEPLADDVVGTGEGRLLANSIWWRVEADGTEGWVNSRYIARLGAVDDLTSQVVERHGSIPSAETMVDLGLLVAEALAPEDPEPTITMTVAPTVGDLGEVTYDLIGLGDDAQRGVRLHVFGQPDAGGEGFSLMAVEATPFCDRGVTDDGRCV